jgi:Transposase IS116/IS110/IS902 family
MATTAGNNSSSWPTFITLLGRLSKADTSARQTHNAGRDSPRAGFVLTAHVLVAEIGVDMARFPTAGHLLSWATMCPRNDESADKRRSRRTCKGDRGSKPPWSRRPGPRSASRGATCSPSSCASKLAAAPKSHSRGRRLGPHGCLAYAQGSSRIQRSWRRSLRSLRSLQGDSALGPTTQGPGLQGRTHR